MLSKKVFLNSGISTIELMVTIAIFVLITTSILISYPQLSSQLSLEKTAQDVASTLHETRMYGIGVKSFGEGGVGSGRTKGYGVHFSKDNNKSYILFSDTDENHQYNPDPTVERATEFKINGSETIHDVCVINGDDTSGDTDACVSSGTTCFSNSAIISADILFARPAPSVFINGYEGETYDTSACPGELGSTTCGRAIIIIKSPRGNCKKIEVWITGQVSVQAKAVTP